MTFKSLLVLGAMTMASSMAWAQGTTSNADCVDALPTEGSKQAYVLSTPRGTLVGTESQYLQATCLPANNTAYAYDKTNGAFQFLLFPAEGQTNGYYIYNVGAAKFLGTRTTASTKSGHNTGVAPMTTEDPAVYYIWKHGKATTGDNGYGTNYSAAEWPWTIGSTVTTSGNNYTTINMTYWNNGVGYDFGTTTSGIDAGNAYAIVPAEVVSDEVYQAAYEILHPTTPPVYTAEFEEYAFYTLKAETAQRGYLTYNANAGTYEGPGLADVTLAGYSTRHPASTDAGVDTRWMLVDNEDGTVYIYNVGANKYLKAAGDNVMWADEEDATVFTYTKVSDGVYNFKANGKYICAACGYRENEGALRMTSHEDACDFVVAATGGSYMDIFSNEEYAPVTISAVGYSTLYSNVNLIVPFGYTAYTLEAAGEYLVATATSTIPANTGVVVAGSEGFTTFFAAENYDSNVTSCLDGTVASNVTTPAGCCTLAEVEGELGFYHYTGATVAPYKAYYVAPAGGESNYRISFGELTSIISAAQQNGGQAIFDLQGRRVVNAKGINIVNGKKVIR